MILLAVARGDDYRAAARSVGRRSGTHFVSRFGSEGADALTPRHRGGHSPAYDRTAREWILREVERPPPRKPMAWRPGR